MPLNLLLASWGNPGNLNPFLTAARRLRERGHRVRILDAAVHRQETMEAGFESLSWRRPAPIQPPQADDGDPFWAEIKTLMEQLMFGAAIDYARDTMDAIRAAPVDAILTNDLLAGPVVAAEAAGIPCALLAPHICIRPIEGIPMCFDAANPYDTPDFELVESRTRAQYIGVARSYLPTLNRARAAFGLAPLRDIFDHYDRADRLLIGISAAFDFPAMRLPENLRYVRPLLDMPAWARPWTAPWSDDSGRPRVLVSLSTSFQDQAAALRRIIAALGSLDVDAVVTTGPAMQEEGFDAPANVTVVDSAPHDEVMRQVSLVVTHGGHGTVARALANGVPLLVMPMGRDQGDNAARVSAHGAGLTLATGAAEEDIASAVVRLVGEPHFREAARRLGHRVAQDANLSVLETEMETIARQRLRRSA